MPRKSEMIFCFHFCRKFLIKNRSSLQFPWKFRSKITFSVIFWVAFMILRFYGFIKLLGHKFMEEMGDLLSLENQMCSNADNVAEVFVSRKCCLRILLCWLSEWSHFALFQVSGARDLRG